MSSTEVSTIKAFLQSGDKRHTLYVNGIVAVVTAALTGGVVTYTQPKPIGEDRLKEIVQLAITPLTYRVEAAETIAKDAKATADKIQGNILLSLSELNAKIAVMAESVARIDERTKGR